MDVGLFMKERLEFIRQLFETSSVPYIERKRKIESQEEPYFTYATPCNDDGEPPFLNEWIEAEESLHMLAYSCISLLAAALHLYFESWVKQSRVSVGDSLKKTVFKKKGWYSGYKKHFLNEFDIRFESAPIEHNLIDEIILARNRIEHPSSIVSQRPEYLDSDFKKLQDPFFVDPIYFQTVGKSEGLWMFPPILHVTNDQLTTAISAVEKLVAWFEAQIQDKL